MPCHDEAFPCLAVTQPVKAGKDTSAAVVEQKDAEVFAEPLYPEGILVIKETQVADDSIGSSAVRGK